MPNSLKSHIETLREMFALAANERRMKEADALDAAIESISRQGGGSKVCETCNGHGMIGGPSFREPDEGGVPCPDCTRASDAGDWALVPREPNRAMIAKAFPWLDNWSHMCKTDQENAVACAYTAMIAAAPAPGGAP